MGKHAELELELPGNDSSLGELLSMLETQGITISRTQPVRVVDPVTVIGIAASAATLIKTLLEIADKISKRKQQPVEIVVRDIEGHELKLSAASEDDVKKLVSDATQ
jgi:hypothetical protein